MTLDIGITLAVLFVAIVSLIWSRAGADLILMGCLGVLVATGAVQSDDALLGFANRGLVTVALMFVVAEGLQQTGAVGFWVQQWLGQPKSRAAAQARFMIPTAFMSAFLNNTPVVAILMPVLDEWARKFRLSVSQLLLPLSYAAILGGLCTLIGTSTTLVVNEMLISESTKIVAHVDPIQPVGNGVPGEEAANIVANHAARRARYVPLVNGLTMFELGWVGLPCCLVGLGYILLCTRWLLPDRKPVGGQFDDPREYTVEMVIEPGSPLVRRTIETAGLRHLPGMYLMEIERDGHILPAVSSNDVLQAEDRLVFVGVVESVVDLRRIPGLKPATDQVFKLDGPRGDRCLIESVVSDTCPIVNMSIREARFRSRYNAAVIAVARNGQRLRGKIGDIQLRVGDTLLLEAHPTFAEIQRNSRDFYLVSKVENSTPPEHERAPIALIILLGMVIAAVKFGMLKSAMIASALMLLTRCVRGPEARRSVDWTVLVTIGAGIGIGKAMDQTGTARWIAEGLISVAQGDRIMTLAVIYGLTMVLTNLITAKAAASVLFFLALPTADQMGISPMPFVIAIIIASAASFATPMGYQTNMMVYGPGGYKYVDYLRFGGPLSIIIGIIAIALIPMIWSF
ncbi:MAG: SLC13 family permease [Planctomycetaceae bacterium]